MTVSDDVLAEQFTAHRAHLMGVAYRLTGTRSDAEDATQEAWLRLSGLDSGRRAAIRDLRAWLTTTVGRICLDRLRSSAARHEQPADVTGDEPATAGPAMAGPAAKRALLLLLASWKERVWPDSLLGPALRPVAQAAL